MGSHQPQSIILQQQQPLEEEVWFGSAGATQLCPGKPGKMCHTFLHLEWSWLAYLCISSFQQTWKILILETRSWLFSYHSGLHWKAYFCGCSTSQSIVQFQSCWTKDQKSQEEWDTDPTESTEAAGYTEKTLWSKYPQAYLSHLWDLKEVCSQMVAFILLSNYSAGRDCTYMQGQQKILL